MSLLCRLLGPKPKASEWIDAGGGERNIWTRITVCLRCGQMQQGETVIGPPCRPLPLPASKQVLGCWR